MKLTKRRKLSCFAAIAYGLALSGCTYSDARDDTASCPMPEGHDVGRAFEEAERAIHNGCEHRFDDYFQHLLQVAEGDPGAENQRRFSTFLVQAADAGLISQRQAEVRYNRYFNVKFMSLRSEYNNCSQTCPRRARVMSDMQQELLDKELGLMKVSADTAAYYRANQLLRETELVLEATCLACESSR